MSDMRLQAIRGMNDILPSDIGYWRYLENQLQSITKSYGYEEIRTPILEKTELFTRSIGEITDIVEKEMYTFLDRNQESVTLRPEGTAGCVRAGIEHGLLFNQPQRLWYLGPIFRHERPQKGRYRQFYQLGVEAFGMPGPEIDAEVILLNARIWQQLGLANDIALHINSLGTPEDRVRYRQDLVSFFRSYAHELDEDSQRRLESNPLRILDSKNPDMKALLKEAPKITEYLSTASKNHYMTLRHILDAAGVKFIEDPLLVRGLDYYTDTVFEWITHSLGAQGTVSAGGRYDGLVALLGGQSTPAVGFAMGCERVIELMKTAAIQLLFPLTHIYFIMDGPKAKEKGLIIAETLRNALTGKTIIAHLGEGGFKSQFKRADKSGALLALILGEDELASGKIGIKFLREKREQVTISLDKLIFFLKELI
jgi:histidyl-tRNA synthetase